MSLQIYKFIDLFKMMRGMVLFSVCIVVEIYAVLSVYFAIISYFMN